MTGLRVLVVGAGIAGLAVAHAARERGIAVEVVERSAGWQAAGAGMYLPANAVRALHDLGLAPAVMAAANPIGRQRVLDHRGRLLVDVDTHRLWDGVGTCVAIHRNDLLHALRDATAGVPIRLGVTVTGLDGPAAVRFSDGSQGSYDVVIGADGVHSQVRRVALGGDGARYVGQVAWRFVVDGTPDITDWTARLGPGRSFLTVALGGGRVYCYADVNSAEPAGPPGDWRELFAGFAEPVPSLLAHGDGAHRSPIEEVVQPGWAGAGVVVIGDAAHASSPNMAQGAAMALEDALILADLLAGAGDDIAGALASFEARRGSRVRWVQEQTHRRDRTRGLPGAIRNPVLRLAGGRIFASNYGPLRARP